MDADPPSDNRAKEMSDASTAGHESRYQKGSKGRGVRRQLDADPCRKWHGRREAELAEIEPIDEQGQDPNSSDAEGAKDPGANYRILNRAALQITYRCGAPVVLLGHLAGSLALAVGNAKEPPTCRVEADVRTLRVRAPTRRAG